MAQAQKKTAAQAWTLEPEKIVPKRRLQRALTEPEILDEFLVNPEDVAERYGVSLNEDEITAVRNASHFLASWDVLCGNGQWLENTRFDGRMTPSGSSFAETTADCIRARVADEILRELPRTIRRVVSEIGSDVLVDPEENIHDLPEHVQPLARTLRRFARTMVRGVTRQLSQTPTYSRGQQQFGGQQQPLGIGQQQYGVGPQSYSGMQQPIGAFTQQAPPGQGTGPFAGFGDGITALGQALAQYLQEVVNHATQEAMEHIRPEFSGQRPRWRQGTSASPGSKEPAR